MSNTWVAGLRAGKLYTAAKRPLDPRWSNRDLMQVLGWCATGQHLGWSEARAFQVAEAMVMRRKLEGIAWAPENGLMDDIETLEAYVSRGDQVSR
jgi:hypothetical protein